MAQKIRITLDPGHGWNYNKGVVNDYFESNKMYDLSLYLKEALEKYGIFEVFITKSKLQEDLSLDARGKAAIKNGSRIFFSLHTNAFSNPSAHGTVTFYSLFRDGGKAIAEKLSEEIVEVLKSDGVSDAYVRNWTPQRLANGQDYYGVIRSSVSSPGVQYSFLIEHAFHTNVEECKRLSNDNMLKKFALAEAKVFYNEMKQYYIDPSVKTYDGTTTVQLNVRSAPSADAQIIGSFSSGSNIKIVSKFDNGWLKVLYNGCAGFVSGNSGYVTTSANIPNNKNVKFPLPNVDTKIDTASMSVKDTFSIEDYFSMVGQVTNTALVVYSLPKVGSKVLGSIKCGEEVLIHDTFTDIGNWFCIEYKDSFGFIMSDYTKLEMEEYKPARVTASDGFLNIREEPNANSKKLGQFPRGTKIWVAKSEVDNWVRAKFNQEDEDFAGYVNSTYISMINTSAPVVDNQNAVLPITFGVTNTSGLNVRVAPDASSKKIGSLTKGYYVIIQSSSGDWYQIVYDDVKAYVHSAYVDIVVESGKVVNEEVEGAAVFEIGQIEEGNSSDWFKTILGARISSGFGYRKDPFGKNTTEFHSGIDYAAAGGTKIYTPVDGLCIVNQFNSGYGNQCIIMAIDGTKHYFCHMKERSPMVPGRFYPAGSYVGPVGTTGSSTGNHLHYEIRKSPYVYIEDNVNPESYIYHHTLNRKY